MDVNLTGVFLCTQHAFQADESTAAARRPHHQQRLHLGARAPAQLRPLHVHQTRHYGLTRSTSLDGRKYDIACGQIDIGNAATEPMARVPQGVMQAHGAVASEPTMDVEHVARAVVYMASLPLEANVQFMTVMATKMPFIGRG